MVAKELNAALSDDKLREQWLKRLLPALVVTVIYFVFISNTLTEKSNKAEEAYKSLMMRGVSEAVLPSMQQELIGLTEALQVVQKKDSEVQAGLATKVGFLFGQTDMNEAIGRIAQLMQTHHLRITDEAGMPDKKISELPRSFADLKTWVGEMLKMGETVHVHRIRFIGSYVDTYEALKDMALSDIRILPLFLSMKNPEGNQDKNIGLKAWTLDLWI